MDPEELLLWRGLLRTWLQRLLPLCSALVRDLLVVLQELSRSSTPLRTWLQELLPLCSALVRGLLVVLQDLSGSSTPAAPLLLLGVVWPLDEYSHSSTPPSRSSLAVGSRYSHGSTPPSRGSLAAGSR